ncbi:hypothetical protein [Streptomyces purpureus]|uniref:Uncharacterized protein n=1 Tax=Streptomyces purpureus TaxID=1951 RepID=A0A918GXE8_9ACTN|nr:hypothetical protein [Streptomyces purpureus]GGT18070.1 hypothetical protein GCM10014713_08600 [Streptomyces purpureus]
MPRKAILLSALSLVPLSVLVHPAAAEHGTPGVDDMPKAQAFDGNTALPSVREVTKLCSTGSACTFAIDPTKSREYTSAVVSVSNGVINCTDTEMLVRRTVKFETGSRDNIGGEISGSATLEGTVDNTTDVRGETAAETATESSHTDHSSPKDKGPNSEDKTSTTNKTQTTAEAKNSLHLGAKASFTMAFKATYFHEWTTTNTEQTEVEFRIKAKDEIQFGVMNAMSRTIGNLMVGGTGKIVKNIAVDSPSTLNSSTIVAQTFTNPDKCLKLRPSGAIAKPPKPPGTRARPPATPAVSTAPLLDTDGRWVRIG